MTPLRAPAGQVGQVGEAGPADTQHRPSASRARVIWAASACAVLGGAAIAPAIPAIEIALGGSTAGVWGRLALILPAVIVMATGPWIGRWSGRVDQGRGFVLSLIALALCGTLGGLVSGFSALLITRIGLGLAIAASLCFATAAIANHYNGAERGQVIGKQAAINTFGGLAFVLLGGVLAQWGWRFPFLLYLLALPIAYFAARLRWLNQEHPRKAKVALAPLWLDLLTLGGGMAAFYLIPAQAPFLPQLADAPALTGLVLAGSTFASGVLSLSISSAPLGKATGLAHWTSAVLVLTGVLGMTLPLPLWSLFLSAASVGAGFGILLPLTVRRIMQHSTPATANALSGLIASALYAGQVAAALLALAFGQIRPDLPFWAMAACLVLGWGIAHHKRI